MKHLLDKIAMGDLAFTTVFDFVKDLVFIMEVIDESYHYIFLNRSAFKALEADERIYGKKMEEVVSPKVYKNLKEKYDQAKSTQNSVEFTEGLLMREELSIGETSLNPIIAEDGECRYILAIVRDVTERKELEKQLENAAFYDYLSGLPNRRVFDDKLKRAIKQAKRLNKKVAILMLDGQGFKKINDTYGHDAGDAVIKEMAKRLQSAVSNNAVVTRRGGDEMAIILSEIDSVKEVEETALRIIQEFEIPYYYNDVKIQIGAGIGISFYPEDTEDKNLLVTYADRALYKAKESNGSHYMFYKNMV